MKANHFIAADSDDYIYSAMLALSDLDIAEGSRRIEQFHEAQKNEFWDKGSVLALSQVLTLCGADDAIVSRLREMRGAFRAQGIKLDRAYTLPMLGMLASLPLPIESLVMGIADAQAFLRSEKIFGPFYISAQEPLLIVSALVADEYAAGFQKSVLNMTLTTGIANIIVAARSAECAAD
jgi:hypothetical protein